MKNPLNEEELKLICNLSTVFNYYNLPIYTQTNDIS